jgi:DNA-binding winged helix-turn-helix (wHTH) protein
LPERVPVKVAFDEFVVDMAARELRRSGRAVHITRKAFDLLLELQRQRPQAGRKEDLQARLWPRTHVGETSLAAIVSEVRAALGDEPRRPRYLRTVHGFGYAFCGATEADAPAAGGDPHCLLVLDRREVLLAAGENVLGRGRDSVAFLDSATVSRRHAVITLGAGGAVLRDLGSHNGTYRRGARISAPVALEDGDEIRLGDVVMTFRMQRAGDGETETQRE